MHRLVPWCAVLLAACATRPPPPPSAPLAEQQRRPGPLSPDQILHLLDSSRISYRVHSAGIPWSYSARDTLARELWPRAKAPLEIPTVERSSDGKRRVVPYPIDREAQAQVDAALEHLARGEHDTAARRVRGVLERKPSYYPALVAAGDLALARGDLVVAEGHFTAATRENPWDHRGWVGLGHVRTAQERWADALTMHARAAALRPRDLAVLAEIDRDSEALGVLIHLPPLLPRAVARRVASDAIDIEWDGAPHWLVWGGCKALWLGEEEHRRDRTGAVAHLFSETEERECIDALLTAYAKGRTDGHVPHEPELDELGAVLDAEMMDELILFELGGRISPHATLLLDDPIRDRIEQYVMRFVFGRKVVSL